VKLYSDIQIWDLIREGRRDALSMLFNRYYRALLNYGLKLNADKPLIKDCIQEVYIQIWVSRNKIAKVKNVKSYLYTALRRKIIELSNSRNSRAQRQRVYATENKVKLLNIEQLKIKKELKKIKKKQLKEAIGQLSNRQREAIYLKFFDGFSNDEIAIIMDVNKQSVYNLISNALKRLEAYLK